MASPLRRAQATLRRHRLAAGLVAGVAACGLLTVGLVPAAAAGRTVPASDAQESRPATWERLAEQPAEPADEPATDDAASDPAGDRPDNTAREATDRPADAPRGDRETRKPSKPIPASATTKAKNVPYYPRDDHRGKRVVYDKALMTVWLINEDDEVVARYPVVGRFDRPVADVYRVYSKSPVSSNPFSRVTFNNMVRFAWGLDTTSSIGLHSIPRYYDGSMMHSEEQLGLAIARGGCVRLSQEASEHVYAFLDVGDRVVVLPGP